MPILRSNKGHRQGGYRLAARLLNEQADSTDEATRVIEYIGSKRILVPLIEQVAGRLPRRTREELARQSAARDWYPRAGDR
jgi:hypothetical protein